MNDLNRIKILESEIEHSLKKIEEGTIGKISDLAYTVDAQNNVTGIALDNIVLKSFPKTLLNFNKLEELSIYQSNLLKIPFELSKLTYLKSLTLGRNFLRNFLLQYWN